MHLLNRVRNIQGPSAMVVLGVTVAVVYLVALGWAMGNLSLDVWGGLVVVPVLLALTVPVARAVVRSEQDLSIGRVIMWAGTFKLVGAVVRYYVTFAVYGSGDADGYDSVGRVLAPLFRSGQFTADIGKRVMGTGFIEIVTGVVYTFTGPSKLGGFFVFSWLGFLGLVLFYRAFRIAFPDGDGRRYAYLVFFLPSMMFWPSSIGKESWMMFTIGLTSYGAARMLAARPFAIPVFALGLLGSAMVRPHVALLGIIGVFSAYMLRRSPKRSLLGLPAKLLVLVILAGGTAVVLSQTSSFFGVQAVDSSTAADQVLTKTTEQTSQGGSETEVTRPSSPFGIGQAIIAVVFRPWPYEAGNLQGLVASFEGVFLLGLILTSLRRLAALPRAMLLRPYVAYAFVYSLLFAYAFSSIGNFGILSRQRVQLYPLLLALLCIPVGFGRTGGTEPADPPGRIGSPVDEDDAVPDDQWRVARAAPGHMRSATT